MSRSRSVLVAWACSATLSAAAQAPKADPADAAAPVPPSTVRSSLDGYRRLGETAPADWKAANQTVLRIGGWRAYAREANAPEPAAAAASAPGTMPMPMHKHRH